MAMDSNTCRPTVLGSGHLPGHPHDLLEVLPPGRNHSPGDLFHCLGEVRPIRHQVSQPRRRLVFRDPTCAQPAIGSPRRGPPVRADARRQVTLRTGLPSPSPATSVTPNVFTARAPSSHSSMSTLACFGSTWHSMPVSPHITFRLRMSNSSASSAGALTPRSRRRLNAGLTPSSFPPVSRRPDSKKPSPWTKAADPPPPAPERARGVRPALHADIAHGLLEFRLPCDCSVRRHLTPRLWEAASGQRGTPPTGRRPLFNHFPRASISIGPGIGWRLSGTFGDRWARLG